MKTDRTVVTFRSIVFNTDESREYFVNPENFGDDLARWLSGQFVLHGVKVDQEQDFPGQEDFGWFFNVETIHGPHCVVVGHHFDRGVFEWVVWIERRCSFIEAMFGGRNKKISSRLAALLHVILSSSSGIECIRWHRLADFERGLLDRATATPFEES